MTTWQAIQAQCAATVGLVATHVIHYLTHHRTPKIGEFMPAVPQTVGELLADVDSFLTFGVKWLPGDTLEAKEAAVNAFLNPRVKAQLDKIGVSEFAENAAIDLIDLAVDSAIALHFTALAVVAPADPVAPLPGTTPAG